MLLIDWRLWVSMRRKQNISLLLFSDKSFSLTSFRRKRERERKKKLFMHWQINRKVFIFFSFFLHLIRAIWWWWSGGLVLTFLLLFNLTASTLFCWESIIDIIKKTLILLFYHFRWMRTRSSLSMTLNKWWQSCFMHLSLCWMNEWIEIGIIWKGGGRK